jgi:hypothetical protein
VKVIRPIPASFATANPLIRAIGTVPGRPTISLQANGGGETAGVGTDVGAGSVGRSVVGAVGVVGAGAAQAARRSAARAMMPRRATGMRFVGCAVMHQADADDPRRVKGRSSRG